ncbi:hypothetical protein D4764_04G0011940 [Takifugu flavidus]|uniref:Uncharacterized protein n=1 Tax=Takifugu flavidus TaxID=433684 RepID=A0A5C6NA71_9TELE|nr:hypothetical protein D4764_04G0011940 [Takifugu flavidus]
MDGDSEPPPFTPRSTWTPSMDTLPPEVQTLITADKQYFDHKFRPCRVMPNLSHEEATALQELRQNINIIIKPADKGSAVVIMDREQYLWEGRRQLEDEEFGEFLNSLNRHNPSIKLKSTINSGSVDFLDTTTFKGEKFNATNNLDVKGDFMEATRTLFRALSTRGYSRSFRRQALREFLEAKPVHVSSVVPLVTTYSFPATLLMKNIKNNFSKILSNHSTFSDCRIIAAYRKNKNLRDLLVKAKIRPLPTAASRSRGEFYKHRVWIRSQRIRAERRWILKLGTQVPGGLNLK